MKKVATCIFFSMAIALFIFNGIGMICDLLYHGQFILSDYSYSKMVMASLVIGLGFGFPSFIYEKDYPFLIQVLFHMGVGCTIMIIASFIGGWMSFHYGLLIIIGELLLAFVIWLIFYVYNRQLAKKMNAAIKSKKTV